MGALRSLLKGDSRSSGITWVEDMFLKGLGGRGLGTLNPEP